MPLASATLFIAGARMIRAGARPRRRPTPRATVRDDSARTRGRYRSAGCRPRGCGGGHNRVAAPSKRDDETKPVGVFPRPAARSGVPAPAAARSSFAVARSRFRLERDPSGGTPPRIGDNWLRSVKHAPCAQAPPVAGEPLTRPKATARRKKERREAFAADAQTASVATAIQRDCPHRPHPDQRQTRRHGRWQTALPRGGLDGAPQVLCLPAIWGDAGRDPRWSASRGAVGGQLGV